MSNPNSLINGSVQILKKKIKTCKSRAGKMADLIKFHPPPEFVVCLQNLGVVDDEKPREGGDTAHLVGRLAHVAARISVSQFLYAQAAGIQSVKVCHEPWIVQLHTVPVPLHLWDWITPHLQQFLVLYALSFAVSARVNTLAPVL
jgi:hypothetical protein